MNNLIKDLESLRLLLARAGVERTHGLLTAMGPDCGYYQKSLNNLKHHLPELKKLLLQIEKEI